MVTGFAAASPARDVRQGLINWQQGLPAEAFGHWRQAALAGDPRGAIYIGTMFDTGHGVAQDYHQAMAWYSKAAGAFNVAVFYDQGLGAPKNPQAAASWYARAAAHGFGRAAYNLALMYEEGAGLPADPARAKALYKEAAKLGIPAARDHLASFERPAPGPARPPEDPAVLAFERNPTVKTAYPVL